MSKQFNPRREALVKDMRHMDNIASRMGEYLFKPVSESLQQRVNWAVAVALLHLLSAEIARIDKQDQPCGEAVKGEADEKNGA